MGKQLFLFIVTIYFFCGSTEVFSRDGPLLITDINHKQIFSENRILFELEQLKDPQFLKKHKPSIFQKEYLLYQDIQDLSIEKLTREELSFIKQMTLYQSHAFKKHSEGPIAVAIFDVASLAKSKWFQHQALTKFNQLKALNADNVNAVYSLVQHSSLPYEFRAAILTVQDYNPKQASDLISLLLNDTSLSQTKKNTLLYEAALVSANANDLSQVLQSISGPESHKLLDKAQKVMQPNDYKLLLEHIIENNTPLASQAIIKYSSLNLIDINLLINKLSDQKLGASAAFALSQALDLDLNKLLSLAVHKKSDRVLVANALLALKLNGSHQARTLLKAAVSNKDIAFTDISEEVSRWLR